MLNFSTAVNLFKNDKIRELSITDEGMRFLKLRSLSRKEHLDYLEKVDQDAGFQLDFYWEGETFSTEADVIFVIKQ
ncbi:hypothetical protein C6501_08145 [Candidatus Poribacteria bacterium]|nr:MAG: hypothetical protein C6501_08145 [Candidatus Poribacteria bacterium]